MAQRLTDKMVKQTVKKLGKYPAISDAVHNKQSGITSRSVRLTDKEGKAVIVIVRLHPNGKVTKHPLEKGIIV